MSVLYTLKKVFKARASLERFLVDNTYYWIYYEIFKYFKQGFWITACIYCCMYGAGRKDVSLKR
jgi:hypothetical protein